MNTNNYSNLCESAKQAKQDVKSVSIMYYVNQLNKLARKNDFIDNVNVLEFGKKVRNYAIDNLGIDIPSGTYFTAYLFDKINGISYYKYIVSKKHNNAFAIDVDIVNCKKVNMSLTGLINAYKAIMSYDAKIADKQAREHNKQENKQARKQARIDKQARKQDLKNEQKQARIDYNNGKIDINTFAQIMSKVA